MQQITDPLDLRRSQELRRRIVDGQTDLSVAWVAVTDANVIAQESGRHLEPDEAVALAEACSRCGITELVAVVNDPLIPADDAYRLRATAEDLYELSRELGGVNFVLADSSATCCILFTTDDFKLVAGPLVFVSAFAGDPVAAKHKFLEFAKDHLDEFGRVLDRAASYMGWIESGS